MADASHPDRIWWSVKQLAEARLPDLPESPRGLEKHIARHNWRAVPNCARRRSGRGGGWEYHWSLFPARAQKLLLAQAKPDQGSLKRPVQHAAPDALWAAFDALPDGPKATAQARLAVVQKVEALVSGGLGRDQAVREVAAMQDVGARTIWSWLGLVDGVRAADWLPALAPRHRMARRRVSRAEVTPEAWDFLKSDFLRPEAPSFSACFRRLTRVAGENGWTLPSERALRDRLEAEVSQLTQILCRKGVEALKRTRPAQIRDRLSLHAMEIVNADYHRFDVFVRWPEDQLGGAESIVRPQMVAFQDVYSGRILSWRLEPTANHVGVSLALGDMIERFGIPQKVLLDNGREFANKFLTGQTPTRFRFKVRDNDIPGVLTSLGCEVIWATPYSGQSKQIERAFRDMCDDIAKDPRFSGAYTGNTSSAKPENYQSRAIDLERFVEVVGEGIEEFNARPNRRGQTTMGRSILETFEASYAEAPITIATEAQRRLWLMGAEGRKAHARTGEITFQGNSYYAEWMHEIRGQEVMIRFDPADLHGTVHVYALDNRYLGDAECRLPKGFRSSREAQILARERSRFIKAERAAAKAHKRLKAAEIGEMLDAAPLPDAATPSKELATVVRPLGFSKPRMAKPAPPTEAEKAERIAWAEKKKAKRAARKPEPARDEDARYRYARAREMEARLAEGETIGEADARWLEGYQTHPEYIALRRIEERSSGDLSG